MSYKIGTRVKKVRGLYNVGCTGVIHSGPKCHKGYTLAQYQTAWPQLGYNSFVKYDTSPISIMGRQLPAGIWPACTDNWEPILLDGLEASNLSYEELLESLKEKEDV